MKHLRNLLAAALTMLIALAIATPAFAAAYKEDVTVTGLEAGDVVTYYQVIKWDVKKGNWVLTDDFKSLIGNPLFGDTEEKVIEAIAGTVKNPGSISQEEADAMAALASSAKDGITSEPLTGTQWKLTKPDSGMYMVIVTAKTPAVVYNPMFVSADYDKNDTTNTLASNETYTDTLVAKRKDLEISKTTSDRNQKLAEAIDSKMGETIDFEITTTVPVFMSSYTQPKFDIEDKISDGITLVPNSVKVYLGGAADPTAASASTFTLDEGTHEYSISFTQTFLKANKAPLAVKIQYQGTVTNEAKFNVNPDNNTVTVSYSNGPTENKGALVDRTNHYTFSIGAQLLGQSSEKHKTYELIKVAVDANGEYVVEKVPVSEMTKQTYGALKDAEFTLYSDSDCKDPIRTFVTDGTGVITFKGLDEGTYYMKETKVPAGYVGDVNKHEIVIHAEYKTITVPAQTTPILVPEYTYKQLDYYTVTVDGVDGKTSKYTMNNDGTAVETEETKTKVNETEIKNTPGVQLPSTGGIGTTIFYVVGGALVVTAGVLLVTKRRMAKMEN